MSIGFENGPNQPRRALTSADFLAGARLLVEAVRDTAPTVGGVASATGVLAGLTERELMLVAKEAGDHWHDQLGNIDVAAQKSLVRLSKSAVTAPEAYAMVRALSEYTLRGIFVEDQQAPALRARKWDTWWWKMFPSGQDAIVLLDPTAPNGGANMLVFRKAIRQQPARLDAALLKAWRSNVALLGTDATEFANCQSNVPGVMTVGGAGCVLLANVVPATKIPVSPTATPPLSVQDVTGKVLTSLAQIPTRAALGPNCVVNVGTTKPILVSRELFVNGIPAPSQCVATPQLAPCYPPQAWNSPTLFNRRYVARQPINAGRLAFERHTVDPRTTDFVLQVGGVRAPQLVAVSWPRQLTPSESSGPTPFLVYWRPTIGQNRNKGFYKGCGGPYPFGWDFTHFGLWRYLTYVRDPLNDPFAKGLPYQIAASFRPVVLVVPLPGPNVEFDALGNAGFVQDLLKTIQVTFFTRQGISAVPGLGPVAMGAFSAGCPVLGAFLSSNSGHEFTQRTLREVYMFEPPSGSIPAIVNDVERWLLGDPQRVVRWYSQRLATGAYNRLLAGPTVPESSTEPFIVEATPMFSPAPTRTVAFLPKEAWTDLTGTPKGFQYVHQVISATMLTDALRRSGF